MNDRNLGRSGLLVSPLCLGTMMLGGETDEPTAARIVDSARDAHAEARGITAGQFAVAWVLDNRLVTVPIAGPRTEAQWADHLGALGYAFTAEDEALVDSLVPAGHPSTPGYTDPAYPLEGRRACTG